MHHLVEERLGVDDGLPCADQALLVPLKRSRAYHAVRRRVADQRPTDAWRQEGFHFFVFTLRPADGAAGPAEPPLAVFAMHLDAKGPVSAVVVTPGPDDAGAEVRDLREPERAYTVPVPA
jgi:hypothetical protein